MQPDRPFPLFRPPNNVLLGILPQLGRGPNSLDRDRSQLRHRRHLIRDPAVTEPTSHRTHEAQIEGFLVHGQVDHEVEILGSGEDCDGPDNPGVSDIPGVIFVWFLQPRGGRATCFGARVAGVRWSTSTAFGVAIRGRSCGVWMREEAGRGAAEAVPRGGLAVHFVVTLERPSDGAPEA